MPIKFKSKAGYVVYKAKQEDTFKLGGLGICDFCNNSSPDGYLIAVLNSYYCPKCYEEWDKSSRFFQEDMPIERKREDYFDHVFRLNGDKHDL